MVGVRSGKHRSSAEVGVPLRKARERHGISIEDAAAQLSIPAAQLLSMEEGDFSAFSAEVYAKGAYMKYATWLGLDAKESQRAMLRALSSARQAVPLRVHTPEKWYKRIVSPRLFIVGSGGLAALIIGGYISWHIRSFWQLPALEITSLNSAVVESESVVIRGRSEAGVKVRVNGETVLLREDATFELLLSMHPGINVVQIEAENVAGRKRIVERHVLRPRNI